MSFFWQKGFYFNNNLYYYSSIPTKTFFIHNLFGISSRWLQIVELRVEAKLMLYLLDWITLDFYLIFYYITTLFPIFFTLYDQYKININFYYLIHSAKGIALIINKPLYRRTRGRTYLKKFNSNIIYFN